MPEESISEKKISGVSTDLIFKLLPYIIMVAAYLVGFGKRDNNIDVVVQQIAELRTSNTALIERVSSLSDRISKIEGTQESLRRDIDQDRAYSRNR